MISASTGCTAAGLKAGAEACAEPQHHFDHRIVGDRAFDDAAVQFDALRAQQVGLAAVVDQIDHRLVEHHRDALGRRAACRARSTAPSFQLATIFGAWPGSAMVSGPWNSLISRVG